MVTDNPHDIRIVGSELLAAGTVVGRHRVAGKIAEGTHAMLYMGEHFNMLIRPVLWRELPIGARVVSHRFTMEDWPPDETVKPVPTTGHGPAPFAGSGEAWRRGG